MKLNPIVHKWLLVMKITFLLILSTLMTVSATTIAQKVTLNTKNAKLETVLKEIKKQTGYDFVADQTLLENAKTVTLQLNNATIDQALEQTFQNQPLTYTLGDKVVTIKEKQPGLLDKLKTALNLDKITVTGQILDERGQPLAGATVTVKGTSNTTTSDLYGNFLLKQVDPNATIVFTYIGYDKKELPAKENMEVIKLDVASNPLSEVKVMAYSRESQRLSVSNSTTIKGEDIAKQPVNNPLLALEGRVPGLFISQNSGIPGASLTVRIQGQNSINGANYPFYVVDGIPYPSVNVQIGIQNPLGGGGDGGYGNPLSYINPSDIESISVLSDADATAIYGSRAANGAIIITTTKGKYGPTQVTADFQQGWGRNTHFLNLLNTQQYLQMRHEAKKNDNAAIDPIFDPDINGLWDTTRYTDWQKKLIGGTAQYTNANLSISGGNVNAQYIVSGTYNRQSDVFPGDFADQKGALHFNLNTTSANQKFKMQLTGNYLYDDNLLPGADYTGAALSFQPDAPALYNPDGSINWAPIVAAGGFSSWSLTALGTNPAAALLQTYERKTNNLIANAFFTYRIAKGLELQLNTGYNDNRTSDMQLNPVTSFDPSFVNAIGGAANARSASYSSAVIDSWNLDPQISYQGNIGKSKIEALIGGTVNQQRSFGLAESGTGYNSDALLPDFAAAATKTVPPEIQSTYKYDALFGRLNYNLDDKYIVSLNARRDGSSRFGSANEFHDFWSVGAGWIFSEEKFMKDHLSFLSFGKLKANYGTTGSDGIGNYQFLSTYFTSIPQVPYQGVVGLITSGLPNPYLQWEETRKLMIGMDLGFLKDRIIVGANYSRNRSSNELINFSLPFITGFGSIAENLPATVQNTSWQFTLSTINIKSKDFRWTSNFNLTIPQNKLLAYPGLDPNNSRYKIGQPLGILHVFHFLGVDPATGLYQFADAQGKPTSTPSDPTDRTVILNPFPKYSGGFENNFIYKRFTLSFLFQFANKLNSAANTLFGFGGQPGLSGNQPIAILNRWQKPGDITTIEKYNSNFSLYGQYAAAENSDAAYSNATYARLKNLSFSYRLPEHWLGKAHIQNCNIYIRGENLLTFTKFKGLDPETTSLPPLKILTAGLQLTF